MAEIKVQLSEEQKLRAVQIAAGIVCVAIGWSVAVQPAFMKVKHLRSFKLEHEQRDRLSAEIEQIQAEKAKLDQKLLHSGEERTVLDQVSSLANKSGVAVGSLVPGSTEGGQYDRLELSLSTRSIFRSLLKFLYQIESSGLNLFVTKLSIQAGYLATPSGGEAAFPVKLTIGTYLKRTEEEKGDGSIFERSKIEPSPPIFDE